MDILLNIYDIHSYYDFIYNIKNKNLFFLNNIIKIQLFYIILKKYKEQYIYEEELISYLKTIECLKLLNIKKIIQFINENITFEDFLNYIDY